MKTKTRGKQKRTGSRHIVLYTSVVIVIVVALFVVNQLSQKSAEEGVSLESAPPTASQPVMGDANAAVSVVEFGDYKCPSCKVWGESVWPRLKQQYVDTGKATFAYINTLFHGDESRLGALAGEAVLLAYPDRFWDFHKALYDAQPVVNHDSLWLTQDKVLEVAKAAIPDLDEEAFRESIAADNTASLVALDELLVRQSNIRETPTIIVNDIVIGNPFDYAEIQAAIERSLQ